MRKSIVSAVVLLLAVGFSLASSGCQTASPAPSAGMGRAVMAGGTTFVEVSGGQGSPVIVSYSTAGKKVCPECEAVATKYFQTGVLDESVCKTCGAHISLGQAELLQPK